MSKIYILILLVVPGVLSSESAECDNSDDCSLLYICTNNLCVHKSLNKIEPIEILGGILILMMCALANSTGIGGGEIMVPLLILLFFFNTHSAVPLSLIIVFGSSFVNTVLRIPRRHGSVDRPLIDYNLVSFAICPLLIGSTLGVLVNRIFPDWLILMTMTALLFYLTILISIKAYSQYIIPKQISSDPQQVVDTQADIDIQLTDPSTDYRIFPPKALSVILGIFMLALCGTILRGDTDSPSVIGVQFCSEAYWGILILRLLILSYLTVHMVCFMIEKTKHKISVNYQFTYDIRWNAARIIFFMMSSFISGFGAGLLGIGGGAIMNPALVYLGVSADVAKASAGLMMFLTCSITVIQYAMAGMVQSEYATWFFMISAIGGSFGKLFVSKMSIKYDKIYLPLVAFAVILGITTLATPTYVITTIANGISTNNFRHGFRSICS